MSKIIAVNLKQADKIILSQEKEMTFGEQLTERMKLTGLSDKQLEGKISKSLTEMDDNKYKKYSVSSETIRKYRYGKRGKKRRHMTDNPKIKSIAKALDTTPKALIEDTTHSERAYNNYLSHDSNEELCDFHNILSLTAQKLKEVFDFEGSTVTELYAVYQTIPPLAYTMIFYYNSFTQEDRRKFLTYFHELVSIDTKVETVFPLDIKVLKNLNKQPSVVNADDDISEQVNDIFNSLEQSNEAYNFYCHLDLLGNLDNLRLQMIADYISLSETRQEMAIRIADQMYTVIQYETEN